MKQFFNPFLKIAGFKALSYGLAAMLGTSLLMTLYNVHLDGILNVHINGEVSLAMAFKEHLINWLALVLLFGLASLILNGRAFRFLDLLGIMAFSRIPFLVMPPLNSLFNMEMIGEKIEKSVLEGSQELLLSTAEYLLFGGYLIISLLFIILSVTWLYNGFRVLSNTKGIRANAIFIVTLLAGVVVSEVLMGSLINV
jgi:hypothetical protein